MQAVGVNAGLLLRFSQRSAHRPVVPGSAAPPGNAAWPAWWRSEPARTVSNRSASSGNRPSV